MVAARSPQALDVPSLTALGAGYSGAMVGRVLVVDDHPAVALALKVYLRRDGRFAVTASAATAAEGLQLAPGHDAVLLDLHLPDMTGTDLVHAFRAAAPAARLVLYTAADDTPAVEDVRGLVDAIVGKGDPEAVATVLAQLIS